MLYAQPGRAFNLSPAKDSIWILGNDVDLRSDRGCTAISYADGELTIQPIFRRFAVWAGELAVHSYFDHLDDTSAEPGLF